MKDAGYDMCDYRAVEPGLGKLAEADALLGEAREVGLRVLLETVPNLAAPAGSPERDRFVLRNGRGANKTATAQRLDQSVRGPVWADECQTSVTAPMVSTLAEAPEPSVHCGQAEDQRCLRSG
jgi:maltooligosyltrehalose synthase